MLSPGPSLGPEVTTEQPIIRIISDKLFTDNSIRSTFKCFENKELENTWLGRFIAQSLEPFTFSISGNYTKNYTTTNCAG